MTVPIRDAIPRPKIDDTISKKVKNDHEIGQLKVVAEYAETAFILSKDRPNQKELEEAILDAFKSIFTIGFKCGAKTAQEILNE